MSKSPDPAAEYATHWPSGERLGNCSTPGSAVTWANLTPTGTVRDRSSSLFQSSQEATSAMTNPKAISAYRRNTGLIDPAPTGVPLVGVAITGTPDPVPMERRLKARSAADWKRASGLFSRHRRMARSRSEGNVFP